MFDNKLNKKKKKKLILLIPAFLGFFLQKLSFKFISDLTMSRDLINKS